MILVIIILGFFAWFVRKMFFSKKAEQVFRDCESKGKLQIFSKETASTLYKLHTDARGQFLSLLPLVITSLLKSFVTWKSLHEIMTPKHASQYYLPVDVEDGLFMHNLIITSGSKTIVEFGTSFGKFKNIK